MLPRAPWAVLQNRGEGGLHLVEVIGPMLVDDHDVGTQTL